MTIFVKKRFWFLEKHEKTYFFQKKGAETLPENFRKPCENAYLNAEKRKKTYEKKHEFILFWEAKNEAKIVQKESLVHSP